jgi:hypothetical protein
VLWPRLQRGGGPELVASGETRSTTTTFAIHDNFLTKLTEREHCYVMVVVDNYIWFKKNI